MTDAEIEAWLGRRMARLADRRGRVDPDVLALDIAIDTTITEEDRTRIFARATRWARTGVMRAVGRSRHGR